LIFSSSRGKIFIHFLPIPRPLTRILKITANIKTTAPEQGIFGGTDVGAGVEEGVTVTTSVGVDVPVDIGKGVDVWVGVSTGADGVAALIRGWAS